MGSDRPVCGVPGAEASPCRSRTHARLVASLDQAGRILANTGIVRYFEHEREPFRGAVGRHHVTDGFRLDHWRVNGALTSLAVSDGSYLTLGVNLGPPIALALNGRHAILPKRGCVLTLPHDDVAQRLTNSVSLVVRVPIDRPELLPVTALAPVDTADVPRLMMPPESGDFADWLTHLRSQTERAASRGAELEQIRSVYAGLVFRLRSHLAGHLPVLKSPLSSGAQAIVHRCFRYARRDGDHPLTSESLAAAAACSVRTLYRTFAEVGPMSPVDYAYLTRTGRQRGLAIGRLLAGGPDAHSRPRSQRRRERRLFGEDPEEVASRLRRSSARMSETGDA